MRGAQLRQRVSLYTKADANCDLAVDIARSVFGDSLIVYRDSPSAYRSFQDPADIIISYRSPWIVPVEALARSELALNWHPGSTRYPGFACYNFALYENSAEYGCVCHKMEAGIDSGEVLEEVKFAITEDDDLKTLIRRTHTVLLELFQSVLLKLSTGEPLKRSQEQWKRAPYTRKDLEHLLALRVGMSKEEMLRRMRATRLDNFPLPYLEIEGIRFEMTPESTDIASSERGE